MQQHCAWWHLLSYSFGHVVLQFHLPTINSISVIINLLGQPSSETPCISPTSPGCSRSAVCGTASNVGLSRGGSLAGDCGTGTHALPRYIIVHVICQVDSFVR